MNVDPRGRSFLSYRRCRESEATLIVGCQLERGIPVWQDIRNLGDGPTEEQVRAALKDPLVSNALLFITPEVAESDFIKKVEVPAIIERFESDPTFFVVTVAAGGLGYSDAAAVLHGYTGVHSLASWNILKLDDVLDPVNAGLIAERVLQQRLVAVASALDEEESVQVGLSVRKPPAFQLDKALSLDWSHHFDGRHTPPEIWSERLLPALSDVATAIESALPRRRIYLSGVPTISAATALGVEFLATRRIEVSWLQFTPGRGEVPWSIDVPRGSCGFKATLDFPTVSSDELAVLVSVNENVTHAFAATTDLSPFRGVLRIQKHGDPPHDLATPGQAADLAFVIRDEIRRARRELRIMGGVHLFMAVPVGLAMMVGQLLNTLGEVHLYEHDPTDGIGRYRHEVVLRPSV